MATMTTSSTESKLRANEGEEEEEDAQASKMLEIINGRTVKTTEEPEDREVWSLEMGDDTVFYSDEEHAQWDEESTILTGFRGHRGKDPVNSVADTETNQQMETNPGEKDLIHEIISKKEKEVNQGIIWTENEIQTLETLTTKRMHVSDPGESAVESYVTPEKFGKTSGEFVMQNTATGNDAQVKKEEAMKEADNSDQHLFDLLNVDGNPVPNGDAEFPQRLSAGNVQAESQQNLGQGQPNRPKKSDCSAFNHLSSSSKYNTVSYRRIRRGNTRQRIEEFEVLLTDMK